MKQALFIVNGEAWADYAQSDRETDQEFENEIARIEAELTREAYREFDRVEVKILIGEVK